MKKSYIIATIKSWNIKNFDKLRKQDYKNQWYLINDKTDLNISNIDNIKPDYIFFPHWSWIIPTDILKKYECVIFHMTDLPYGRGGSPLQNLIQRRIYKTKISALKAVDKLDAGPIYLKKSLDISHGSAEKIYQKASNIIFEKMIPQIIQKKLEPRAHLGEPVIFKRRNPEQSNIKYLKSLQDIYDQIRMLDAEGYPKAFLDMDNFRIEFSKAKLKEKRIFSSCIITLKGEQNESNGNSSPPR